MGSYSTGPIPLLPEIAPGLKTVRCCPFAGKGTKPSTFRTVRILHHLPLHQLPLVLLPCIGISGRSDIHKKLQYVHGRMALANPTPIYLDGGLRGEDHNQPAWKAIEVLANPAEITRAKVAMIKAFREALRASWSSSCSSR